MVWSYILDYENSKNPYEDRKLRIKGWKKYAVTDIQENDEPCKNIRRNKKTDPIGFKGVLS